MKTRILVIILALAACGKAPARVPKIGVSMGTMKESVYLFMQQEMLERQAADGVEILWLSAGGREAQQKADVEELISRGVNVIILHAANTDMAGGLVRRAAAADIPVIAMDRLPFQAEVALYVTADSRRVGQLQAEHLARSLGGKGGVVILQGDEDNSVAKEITAGNLEVLTRYPDIQLLLRQPHEGWRRDLARATMEEAWAQYPDAIQGVLANNSSMAMGALDAAAGLRLARPPVVVGADADRDACEAIVAGRLSADVDKMPAKIAGAAYEAALRLIRGEAVVGDATITNHDVRVKVRLTPVRLLTQDNVARYMEYRWGKI